MPLLISNLCAFCYFFKKAKKKVEGQGKAEHQIVFISFRNLSRRTSNFSSTYDNVCWGIYNRY